VVEGEGELDEGDELFEEIEGKVKLWTIILNNQHTVTEGFLFVLRNSN
jgi:hypothetical protein